jgi:hypothetical protein
MEVSSSLITVCHSSVFSALSVEHGSSPIAANRSSMIPLLATPRCCADSRIFFIAQNRSGASSASWSNTGVDANGDMNSTAPGTAGAGEVPRLKLPTDSPPPLADGCRPMGDSRCVTPPSSGHAPRVVTCLTQNGSWSPLGAACSSWS